MRDWEIFHVGPFQRFKRFLWYPSCGSDFRPLLYFSRHHICKFANYEPPELFIFTDYDKNAMTFDAWDVGADLFKDERTTLKVQSSESIFFDASMRYDVNAGYASFPGHAYGTPQGRLFGVQVQSELFGTYDCNLLMLAFENVCFFREYVSKHALSIPFLYHVRDGSAFGGTRFRFAFLYNFAHAMKLQLIVTDHSRRADVDWPNGSFCKSELRVISENEKLVKGCFESLDSTSASFKRLGTYSSLGIVDNEEIEVYEVKESKLA